MQQTGDRAIIIFSRFYFTNLPNFFKKPISIKRIVINRRTEFFSQVK